MVDSSKPQLSTLTSKPIKGFQAIFSRGSQVDNFQIFEIRLLKVSVIFFFFLLQQIYLLNSLEFPYYSVSQKLAGCCGAGYSGSCIGSVLAVDNLQSG